jgi:hypothetical protein
MRLNMKPKNFLYVVVKISLALLAIAAIDCNNNPVSTIDASLGIDFDIKYGQIANFKDDDLSVTFKDIADERCPIGLKCFWEGSAYITLNIQKNGATIIDTVQTFKPEKIIRIGSAFNYYLFTVKALVPYPVYEKEVIKEKYTLTLNISRASYIRKGSNKRKIYSDTKYITCIIGK